MKSKKNIYLIAGGGSRKPETLISVFSQILSESGKEEPDIAYIGAANGDDPTFYNFMKSNLEISGKCNVSHIFLSREKVDIEKIKSSLKKTDIVFVSGGDVLEGMKWLKFHNLTPFLKELYENGKTFFGISAGSIMLGTQWVDWKNPNDDSTAGLFECMGLVQLMCDTHAEKDGWEELKMAVSLNKENTTGYGIPSGGVIVAAPDGTLSALGKPAVIFTKTGGQVIKAGELAVKKQN